MRTLNATGQSRAMLSPRQERFSKSSPWAGSRGKGPEIRPKTILAGSKAADDAVIFFNECSRAICMQNNTRGYIGDMMTPFAIDAISGSLDGLCSSSLRCPAAVLAPQSTRGALRLLACVSLLHPRAVACHRVLEYLSCYY